MDTIRDLLREVKLEGWVPIQYLASEGAARGPGPWAILAEVLILTDLFFSHFFGKATVSHARPNVSDLLPGTQIGLSLCPTSHTQLSSQRRTCCLTRPMPSKPLQLPEAPSLCIQVSQHNSPRSLQRIRDNSCHLVKSPSGVCTKGFQKNYLKAQAPTPPTSPKSHSSSSL